MASVHTDKITAQYSVLQSLSASDLEDSVEWNICHTLVLCVKINAVEMHKLQ